jgi:uncharacterized membrane protein YhhN
MSGIAWSLVTLVGAIGFLIGEKRRSEGLRWTMKPLASIGFVAAAISCGSLSTPLGRWVTAALALSLVGDVLLLSRSTFVLGLGAFLVGHLLFAAAFLVRGVSTTATALAALGALAVALPVARWLLPHVGKMRVPVIAYMAAISTMVSLAAGSFASASAAGSASLLLLGAVGFYLSDLSVARDRFVAPGFVNRAWGLPLYYGAQLCIAASAAA